MGEPVNTRSAARVAVEAFVRIRAGGSESEYVFRTRDLSRTGFFLYTRVPHAYPLAPGTPIELELFDYDGAVACRCVVARVVEEGSPEAAHYPVGFGVKIVEIDAKNRERLGAMLERLARDGAPY